MAVKKLKLLKYPSKPKASDTPTQKLKYLEKVKETKKENASRVKSHNAQVAAVKKLNDEVEKTYKNLKK